MLKFLHRVNVTKRKTLHVSRNHNHAQIKPESRKSSVLKCLKCLNLSQKCSSAQVPKVEEVPKCLSTQVSLLPKHSKYPHVLGTQVLKSSSTLSS